MKFTIFGFSQTKLVEYGLDTNDAMILRWLVDFVATGKMKKTIEDNEIFYLVQYEAIIKEFPVMGINSIKAISNRFDKFVNLGLLNRKVKRGGSGRGSFTCYSLTILINEMMYENQQLNDDNKTGNSEVKNNIQPADNNNTTGLYNKQIPVSSNSDSFNSSDVDRNQTSGRENIISERNLNSAREVKSDSDRNQTSLRQEPNFSPTGTKLPVGLNNHSIINSSSINSSSNSLENAFHKKEEELIKNLNYFVDTHIFSDDFIPKLIKKLDEYNILPVEYKDFAEYTYDSCYKHTKDKTKLMSYMYATASDNYFISGYLETKKKEAEAKTLTYIKCPVCSTNYNKYHDCPECELRNPNSKAEILFRKTIYSLPKDTKNKLNKELDELVFADPHLNSVARMNQYKKNRELVYQKYCNISHEDYITIFGA